MIPAHSYNSICDNLFDAFNQLVNVHWNGNSNNLNMEWLNPSSGTSGIENIEFNIAAGKNKLVGILFVQPSHKIAREEILPNLAYYHYRSRKNINFYLSGYGAYWNEKDYKNVEPVCSVDGTEWYFSLGAFDDLRREIESKTKWFYSGECDLILTNAMMSPEAKRVDLDFSNCIKVNLDELKRTGSIPTVMNLFEEIFRYAESQYSFNPAWGLSDTLGKSGAKSGLLNILLSLLPKGIGKEAAKIGHFAVIDVSKRQDA